MWSSKRQRISDPSNSSEGNTKKKKKKERKLINKSQQKHRDEQREVRVHLVPMEKRHLVSRDWVKNIFKTWENERKGQCSK